MLLWLSSNSYERRQKFMVTANSYRFLAVVLGESFSLRPHKCICTTNNYLKSIRNLGGIPAQVHSHRNQFVHGRVTFVLNVDYSDLLGAYRSLALAAKVHIDCQKFDPGRRSERPGAHVSSGTGVGGRTRLGRPRTRGPGAAVNPSEA